MLRIIDNVPGNIADSVEQWITGTKIPWFYFNHTLGIDPKGQVQVHQDKYIVKDLPRFTHYFYPNSTSRQQDEKYVLPLTSWLQKEFLPDYRVLRVMGNLTTQMPEAGKYLNLPHIDSDGTKFTFLYYVNNSDGNTVFFQNSSIYKEVEPVKGTGVLFSSNTPHAGQVPSINKTRYVINIIFGKRD